MEGWECAMHAVNTPTNLPSSTAGPGSNPSGSAIEEGTFVKEFDCKLANTALCYSQAVPSCPALPPPALAPDPSAGRKFPVSSGIPNLLLTEDEC